MGQDTTHHDLSEMDTIGKASVDTELYTNGNGSTNRLPSLLMDVKVLLSEAMIADVHRDTLEVIYYLDRIYDLLGEADQLGEKTQADQEEFDRFIASLNDIYTKRLHTLDLSDAPITAAYARQMIDDISIPVEMEMGNTKFIVVDSSIIFRPKGVDNFRSGWIECMNMAD
jgi:hypothetical protein